MSIEWRGIDYMRSGPLFGIAGRASLRIRRRAYEWLRDRVGGFQGKVVLDHGSTPDTTSADSNCHIPWLMEDGATVFSTSAEDITHLPAVYPGLNIVPWPPQEHFTQRADVVMSSSVIAHVGDRPAQLQFVANLLRLGDVVFLTTPNRRHWLEFHTKIPLLHWLSNARYHAVLQKLGLGFWAHLYLLTHNDVQSLFEDAAAQDAVTIETQWFKPRFLGPVSNLVVLCHVERSAPSARSRNTDEANVFGNYVIGEPIDRRSAQIYDAAIKELGYTGGDAVVEYALKHPGSIGLLDGALALTRPDALLRRKLLVMAAVLETQPKYASSFLPRTYGIRRRIGVACAALRGAIEATAGLLLLRALG